MRWLYVSISVKSRLKIWCVIPVFKSAKTIIITTGIQIKPFCHNVAARLEFVILGWWVTHVLYLTALTLYLLSKSSRNKLLSGPSVPV